jgi:hypothetical protein
MSRRPPERQHTDVLAGQRLDTRVKERGNVSGGKGMTIWAATAGYVAIGVVVAFVGRGRRIGDFVERCFGHLQRNGCLVSESDDDCQTEGSSE